MTDHETLTGLVERYSPSGCEAGAVQWLAQRMRALGYHSASVDEAGNAVGSIGDGPNQIVLLGHIDTVPGEIPVRMENGVLHGRGSVDAKGPLAAFVDAAAQTGSVPGWQIVVIGAVDEEGESAGAWHIAPRYHPRYAVIGEPSGWERITLGYKGILHFTFQARETLGHSATPDESACEIAVGCWNRLVEICRRENANRASAYEQITPSLRTMHCSDDGFEEQAELSGNVRLPPNVTPEGMSELLREAAGSRGSAEVAGNPLLAYRTGKTSPLVGALVAGVRAANGHPGFNLKLGTSDINIVGPAWNCPMAVYGPGDSTLDHTPRENILLDDYDRSVRVLSFALRRLTRQAAA